MTTDFLIAAKAAYILGWVNIFSLIVILFSCRCILGLRIEKLSKSKLYMRFYRYHCYYWWVFIISVALHAILAITAFGNPFSG
ncbi:MAG: hypothetical protein HN411_04015 [Waddliaceae bacterium]|jgi:hypothetical protein|nr:hypothetical protein [Waddliaceae bacterium]MBT3579189.1 hypothetical protein [Waddliaceae bacterium]MBT4444751.1 hypothetical protein [Waddliaceae bacterium]MBT6928889.1 hypothetical protein [Waddliaceae bacterium]MBT7462290.1 hypothetical protein [Waddliaceae bacterium]